MNALQSTIDQYCVSCPSAAIELNEFVRLFRIGNPSYTRSQVLSLLSEAGFKLGTINKQMHVAGLAAKGEWKNVNGNLILQAN